MRTIRRSANNWPACKPSSVAGPSHDIDHGWVENCCSTRADEVIEKPVARRRGA